MKINKITPEQVKTLNAKQLTNLLKKLLHLEAQANGIMSSAVGVSLDINVPDGGEDGRIKWLGEPEKTNLLPNSFTLFQCKASNLGPSDCKKELLNNDNTLKPQTEQLLKENGTYVLFTNKSDYNQKQKRERIEKFKEAVKDAGNAYPNAQFYIYSAGEIAAWVNQYIAAVTYVYECNGISRLRFMTWQKWSEFKEYKNDYWLTNELLEILKDLREGRHKVTRVLGQAGLGKTRLLLEAFRPPNQEKKDINQQAISDAVVYYDAALDYNGLIDWVTSHATNARGILIVDNCSLSLHEQLAQHVDKENASLQLITVDYDTTEKINKEHHKIELYPAMFADVCNDILVSRFREELDGLQINKLIRLSGNYPLLALQIANSSIERMDIELDDLIYKKLIYGRGTEDKEAYKVLEACALFNKVGIQDEKKTQGKWIAENLCELSWITFHRHCKRFLKKGIMEQRGRLIFVKPLPLAIALAQRWWAEYDLEEWLNFIPALRALGMLQSFLFQARYGYNIPEIQEGIGYILDSNSLQIKNLHSSEETAALYNCAYINPEKTLSVLERAFVGFKKVDFEQIWNRAYLKSTLDLLCFEKATFNRATKILLELAVAENERGMGNNATHQFCTLFQFFSLNQVDLTTRLDFLDEILERYQQQPDYIKLIIWAMKATLILQPGYLDSDSPKDPYRQKEVYIPTHNDVYNYRQAIFVRLRRLIIAQNEYSQQAQEVVINCISSAEHYGSILFDILQTMITINSKWNRMLYVELNSWIKYNQDGPEEIKQKISLLKKQASPKTFYDKLNMYIVDPFIGHDKDSINKYLPQLVKELFQSDVDIHKAIVMLATRGGSDYTYVFKFCELWAAQLEDPKPVLDLLIETASKIPDNERNGDIIKGFLSGLKADNIEMEYILTLLMKNKLAKYIINYVTFLPEWSMDLMILLFKLVDNNSISINQFDPYLFRNQPYEDIIKFCEKAKEYGPEGLCLALRTYEYSYQQKREYWPMYKNKVREIILHENNSLSFSKFQYFVFHLLDENKDEVLARRLANMVIKSWSKILGPRKIFPIEREREKLIKKLTKDYPQLVLQIWGDFLLKDYYKVITVLGNTPFFLRFPTKMLLEWCEKHQPIAPRIVVRSITYNPKNKEQKAIYQKVIKTLINQYGTDEEFLNSLGLGLKLNSSSIKFLQSLTKHSIPTVRNWAIQRIQYRQEHIEKRRFLLQEEMLD